MRDWQLINQYVRQGSQAAFTELVARHQRLVYGLCMRELHDPELASDATQVVFLIMARKAPTFRSNISLPGWLFQTARFAAKNVMRQERSRQVREHKMAEEISREMQFKEIAAWESVDPLLIDALARLSSSDRDTVLLRFFEERTFPEIGKALQITEDAARVRVNRSIEKLRRYFAHHGIVLSGALLAVLLAENSAQAVPPACSVGLSQISVVYTAGHASAWIAAEKIDTLSEGVMKAMKMMKLKAALAATAITLVGASGAAMVTHAYTIHAVRSAKVVKATVPAIDPKAKVVLDEMIATYRNLTSYSAVIDGNQTTPGTSGLVIYHATISYTVPNKVNVIATAHSVATQANDTAEAIADGTHVFMKYAEIMPHYLVIDQHEHSYAPNDSTDISNAISVCSNIVTPSGCFVDLNLLRGSLMSATLIPQAELLTVRSTDSYKGIPIYTVIAKVNVQTGPNQFYAATRTLCIGKQDHLLLAVMDNGFFEGKVFRNTLFFSRVKVNPALPDSTFTFAPPAGLTPVKTTWKDWATVK